MLSVEPVGIIDSSRHLKISLPCKTKNHSLLCRHKTWQKTIISVNLQVDKTRRILLDFEVDKLTNSIENIVTGDSFRTEVILVTKEDIKAITKKNGWDFNWKYEFKQPDRDLYRLSIVGNPRVIQGLISLSVHEDHVYMHLIESASFNKGRNKMYAAVPGNLVAYAAKLSFQ